MIGKIKRYIHLISKAKLKFSNPKKKKILIFDDEAIDDFKYLLLNRKYFILAARFYKIKKIYISLEIILFFFRNFNFNIFSSYIIALIKVIKPEVILTTIDNSSKFHEIAKFFKKDKIKFIAIQCAARYDLAENNLLYKKKLINKNPNRNYFIPHFICYGNYVEKEYRKNKIQIGQYYKFGSLRLSNYIKYLDENKIQLKKNFYDIAFISGASKNKDKIYNEIGIDEAWAKMCIYTIRYCLENNLRFAFISRIPKNKNKKIELDFFKKYLSNKEFSFLKKNFLANNEKNFSSYKAIHECNVLTGVVSTMLQDKLALKGKIFVCNFTNHDTWDFPIKNFCFLKKPSYQLFTKRLSLILKISNKKYLNLIKNKDLIYLNKQNLTHQLINKHLDKLIGN